MQWSLTTTIAFEISPTITFVRWPSEFTAESLLDGFTPVRDGRKDLILLLSAECHTVRAGMERSALQRWRGNKHSRQHSKTLKHINCKSIVIGLHYDAVIPAPHTPGI
jgi:hypothetical protein